MWKSAGVNIVRDTNFYFASVFFLLKSLLLDIFVKTFFSGVVPSERAPTQLSEYVGHIGVQMIKTIVIAAQSQDRACPFHMVPP